MQEFKMDEDMTLPSFSQRLPPKFTTMRPPGLGGMSSQSLNKGRLSLPELSGDLSLEVFTHRSVPRASQTNAKWGDNTRLAVLGEEVMRLIITNSRAEFLSDANVDSWANMFGLKDKMRVSQDKIQSLSAHEETRILFASFIGAVYFEHGMHACQKFISQLMDPDTKPPPQPKDTAAHALAEPPQYSASVWPSSSRPIPPVDLGHQPPQPTVTPPPAPQSEFAADASTMTGTSDQDLPPPPLSAYSQSLASLIPASTFLPLFNQTANQRRAVVDYPAIFSGPAHAGQWHVRCTVNGVEKGQGAAASKQLAKEDAARQAYFAMGWDARPGSVNYPGSSRSASEFQSPPPPPPRTQEDVDMGSASSYMGTSAQTPPPMSYNRTTGPQSYPGNYPATAPPPPAYLPLFNQTATQRRLVVDYPAEFSGPAHAGRWTVRCTVNGVVKGQGQGMSKQLAKEDAAKQAWFNMGWGPRI